MSDTSRRTRSLLRWLENQWEQTAALVTDAGDSSLWAKDEADTIRGHIKTVKLMAGWQPIETAPKGALKPGGVTTEMILLASTSGHVAIGYWGRGIDRDGPEGWCNPHDHMPMRYWNAFTHWRPIGSLPEQTPPEP